MTDADVVQSAMMKAQAEGSKIAANNVSRILNEGKNNEFSQWKAKLAELHSSEDAMAYGRDVASGKKTYQEAELFLRDNPKAIDAVRDGFVDEYAREFRTNPETAINKQAANEEMRRSIEMLFGPESAKKMTDTLNRQAQLIQIERGTSGPFRTAEEIAKKAKPVASEFGGEKLYKEIARLEVGATEAKGMADAVQSGRDIFSAQKLPSDLAETMRRLSPDERAAHQMGFLEKMMQDPEGSLKKMASPESDMYRKVEVALSKDLADEFNRLAKAQQTYGSTAERFVGGMEAKANRMPKTAGQNFFDLLAALYQATAGFIGSRADVAKRFLPGASPMAFPSVRSRYGELLTAPPGQRQPLTNILLGQQQGFQDLSRSVLGRDTPIGAYNIGPSVERAGEADNRQDSEAKQLRRGERPL
jgi:hypothetical protein